MPRSPSWLHIFWLSPVKAVTEVSQEKQLRSVHTGFDLVELEVDISTALHQAPTHTPPLQIQRLM